MELDIKSAQHLTQGLVKVYGRLPYGQLVLIKGEYESKRESYTTVPAISIPFDLCERDDSGSIIDCSFAIHELGHYFTWNLLRTNQSWFDEGLSMVMATAQAHGVINLADLDIATDFERGPKLARYLTRDYDDGLKSGKNVFKPRECTAGVSNEEGEIVKISFQCIDWLGAHDAGYMFFYALAKDYGISGSEIGEFVRTLVELAKDGRIIGTEDFRTAVKQVSGKDIDPLLDLLEPAIKFNGYDGRGAEFIKRHPEYSTDETSWID